MLLRRWAVREISFPEHISESTWPITVILHIHVPSCAFSVFWTLKLTQLMAAYRPLFTSTVLILQNIMKTTQDSYTITIKQIVRFQDRMLLKKCQLDQIQNGRL